MKERVERAKAALEGLSVGDAFGEKFFVNPHVVEGLIADRAVPASPWSWTDDTAMAISVLQILVEDGEVDQVRLNKLFTQRYFEDSSRGYGPSMHGVFERIRDGENYVDVVGGLFEGQGSYGNGAAMRVAPVGAYFADDLGLAIEYAEESAVATHANPEAIAGAIAVAVAAVYAWRLSTGEEAGNLMTLVEPYVPESQVRQRLLKAIKLPEDSSVALAVSALGSGNQVSAFDTVPFCLWCASRHLSNFEEAMWLTVSGLGDRDTTCAIVGGIVAVYTGLDGIPVGWLESREPLPEDFGPIKPRWEPQP